MLFFLVVILYSCNDNDCKPYKHHDKSTLNKISDSLNYSNREKHFGISLINDPLKGASFTDSTQTTKLFIRWIRIQIINDTTLPIRLQLNFSNNPYSFHLSNEKFKIFLFSDTKDIVLNTFLKTELKRPSSLDKIMQPGQSISLNLGMLFRLPGVGLIRSELFFKNKKPDLYIADTLPSLKNVSLKDLELVLGVTLSSSSTYHATIPCGKLSFVN